MNKILQKSFVILFAAVFVVCGLFVPGGSVSAVTAVSPLYFSEYIEGSSNNKALEIYNSSGASINLVGYSVVMYFNGNSSAGLTINLTGTVAAGDVYVIANQNANATILAQADQTATGSWYNGNDAVALQYGLSIIDVIGQIGLTPGQNGGQD